MVVQLCEGVQESYDDVCELLVYFWIWVYYLDFDMVISVVLEKFEGQIGIMMEFQQVGGGLLLLFIDEVQMMYIVQELFLNICKYVNVSYVQVMM